MEGKKRRRRRKKVTSRSTEELVLKKVVQKTEVPKRENTWKHNECFFYVIYTQNM